MQQIYFTQTPALDPWLSVPMAYGVQTFDIGPRGALPKALRIIGKIAAYHCAEDGLSSAFHHDGKA